MRTIDISTDVFAAIWALRQNGEESEDAILKRVLVGSNPETKNADHETQIVIGVYDARNDVRFPEGFGIQRTYKGVTYKAVAEGGNWRRLDNGEEFPTLNQLNCSIADGNENVWNGNWKYLDPNGRLRSINELRK